MSEERIQTVGKRWKRCLKAGAERGDAISAAETAEGVDIVEGVRDSPARERGRGIEGI